MKYEDVPLNQWYYQPKYKYFYKPISRIENGFLADWIISPFDKISVNNKLTNSEFWKQNDIKMLSQWEMEQKFPDLFPIITSEFYKIF